MKRPKKRFNSREEILAEIDRYKIKFQRHMDRAQAFDVAADEYIICGTSDPEQIGYNREQAKKCRKSAYNIENNKLVKLKQKLAEFDTTTMNGIINDPSIQR